MKLRVVIVLLSLIPAGKTVRAQADVQRAAADAWNARDWARVAEAYASLSKTDTITALPHMRLGVALTALGRYAEARKEVEFAAKKGAPLPRLRIGWESSRQERGGSIRRLRTSSARLWRDSRCYRLLAIRSRRFKSSRVTRGMRAF